MTFTKLHTVVAIVGIALAGGVAYWVQNRPAPVVGGTTSPTAGAAAEAGGAAGPAGAGAGRHAAAAGTGRAAAGGPVLVEVGRVETTTLQDDEVAVGSLRARQGVMLRPEVSGRVARLGFSDGQRVRRGQVLVELDDTLQAAQLRQAQAQAQIARTNLQRNRELLADRFISQSAVDQTAAALEVAEAQVSLARAQLSRMKIVAPFDGVAGIRSIDVGDYVKDGADLVGVEDTSSVWVDFRLPERVMARLRTGQAVEVSFDAVPARRFKGRVEAMDAQLDANGRSLLVRARVDNPGGLLRSGMFARVRTVFAQRDGALVVPEEALVPQGDKRYLFKVIDGPGGAKLSQRLEAQVGLRLPGKAEILSGLAAGDLVVTAGHAALLRRDGQALKIVEVGGAAPGPAAAASGRTEGIVFSAPGPAAVNAGAGRAGTAPAAALPGPANLSPGPAGKAAL